MSFSDILIQQLRDLDILSQNMRCQEYDNETNLKGKYSGVQRQIRNINPRTFFIPCSAHSFNHVNDAVKSLRDAISFFSTIQKVYIFFSAFITRWQVFLKYITNLTLYH
jgi:hypothetical protein